MKNEDLSEVEVVDLASLQRAILETKEQFAGLYPLWRGHANIDWKLQAEVFRPTSNGSPANESTPPRVLHVTCGKPLSTMPAG